MAKTEPISPQPPARLFPASTDHLREGVLVDVGVPQHAVLHGHGARVVLGTHLVWRHHPVAEQVRLQRALLVLRERRCRKDGEVTRAGWSYSIFC